MSDDEESKTLESLRLRSVKSSSTLDMTFKSKSDAESCLDILCSGLLAELGTLSGGSTTCSGDEGGHSADGIGSSEPKPS